MSTVVIRSARFPRQRGDAAETEPEQYQIHLEHLSATVINTINVVKMPVDRVSRQSLLSGHRSPDTFHRASLWTQQHTVYTTAASSACTFISYLVTSTPIKAKRQKQHICHFKVNTKYGV